MSLSKEIFILPLIIAFVALAFIFTKTDFFQPQKKGFEKVYIGKTFVFVKIARTYQEREKGLSGVKQMGQDEGMLFIFPQKQQLIFWMKDMNFPLDFVWIADNKVVDIHQNIPAPSSATLDNQIATARPRQPVDMVLEVNASWITKQKIKIGDNFLLKE